MSKCSKRTQIEIASAISAYLEKLSQDRIGQIDTSALRSACGIKSNSVWQELSDSGIIDEHRVKVGKTRCVWKYNGGSATIISPHQARTQAPDSPLEHALRQRLIEVERELSKRKKEEGRLALFNEEIKEHIIKLPPYFSEYHPQHKSKVSTPVTAVAQLCDWQIGQIINKHMTNCFGSYNYNEAVDRAFQFVDDFTKWLDVQRSGYIIKNGVIIINGDMINGELRLSAAQTNEFPVPAQVVRCATLLAETIRRIACNFEHLRVEFIVPDNHSRRTRKVQMANAGLNSDNFPVAELTSAYLKDISQIEWRTHLEITARVVVNGVPYLVEHGSNCKNALGYPWYYMGRKVGMEAKKRIMTPRTFRKMIIGHFHAPMFVPDFIVGGSLCGTSENDAVNGRHYPPSQTAWLVHPKNREFNWLDFILGEFEEEEEQWYDWVNDLPEAAKQQLDANMRAKSAKR